MLLFVHPQDPEPRKIKQVVEILQRGGVVICPTDTVYAFVCSAHQPRAIEALAELAPETASVIRDGKVTEVAVDALAIGDTVLVRPNERLPADGFVIKGESSINQAPITGDHDRKSPSDP